MHELLAGVARVDITPAKGTYLAGYGNPFRTSRGTRDPLTATVLVLDDKVNKLCVLSLDLLSIHEDVTQRIRESIAKKSGIPADHVLIACSHSHCAPVASIGKRSNEKQRHYVHSMQRLVVEACEEATQSMVPVRLFGAHTTSDIAVNRRQTNTNGETVIGHNPDGPVDRQLSVLQLVQAGGDALATIVNLACHPTTLSPSHRLASAAWPGVMRRKVEEGSYGPCLFLQGATGDLNPNHQWGKGELEAMERLGNSVANQVLASFLILEEYTRAPLMAKRQEVWLQIRPEDVENITDSEAYLKHLQKRFHLPKACIRWLLDKLYPWTTGLTQTEDGAWQVPMEIQTLRIGDCAIVAHGAETFHELAVRIKTDSPAAMTLFAGYANGMIGYLPTEQAHAEGGYEVDIAPYIYRLPGRLVPSAGDVATDASLRMVEALWGSPSAAMSSDT